MTDRRDDDFRIRPGAPKNRDQSFVSKVLKQAGNTSTGAAAIAFAKAKIAAGAAKKQMAGAGCGSGCGCKA